VVDDSGFFTNFFQLGGVYPIDLQNNMIDYSSLPYSSLQDMFEYSDYQLFSVFYEIFH
jgi:hypothetical protein